MNLRCGIVFFFALFHVSSCNKKQISLKDTYRVPFFLLTNLPPERVAETYQKVEKNCTPESALKDIGKAKIWVEGLNGLQNIEFDFHGISGNGLQSEDALGVRIEFRWKEEYFDCKTNKEKDAFRCESLIQHSQSEGSPVLICKIPKDGYPVRSVENIALVAIASYKKTLRDYSFVSDKSPPRNIMILVAPIFEKIFHIKNENTELRYDVDKARWTQKADLRRGWNYTIQVLPSSLWMRRNNPMRKDLFLQMGVISHEAGHHIFASRVPKLKKYGLHSQNSDGEFSYISYFEKNDRNAGVESIISAIDEAYADSVSHLTFASSTSIHYTLESANSSEARRVSSPRTSLKNTGPEYTKALTEPVLRHFLSLKKTQAPQDVPDHQDIHTVGAILAHSLDALFGNKVGDSREDPRSEEKYKLLNAWIDEIEKLFLSKTEYYSDMPSQFLNDALWVAVKLAFIKGAELSKTQCEILEQKFPVFVVDWKKRYRCH